MAPGGNMDQIIAEARDAFADAEEQQQSDAARREKILADAKEDFQAASDSEYDDRQDAIDDIRFARLGEQWPAEVKAARERAKRPCLTINKMGAFRRQVVNDARQNRPSIKVKPVDSTSDPRTAEVMNGLIRNIEYSSQADVAYDTGLECAVDGGVGYWRVGMRYANDDGFELDLCIDRISNPFTVYRDPRSQAADSSDWNVAFVTEKIKRHEFEEAYKGAQTASWQAQYDSLDGNWLDDDGVRLAEYWKRTVSQRQIVQLSNGAIVDAAVYKHQRQLLDMAGLRVTGSRTVQSHEVRQYILTGAEVLEERRWPGRYIPIVPVYGDEVNIEGKRHFRSLIRDSKDAQRMFNYWRTTTTELVALAPKAPWVGPKGSFNSAKGKWASANTDAHPYLEYDPVPGQSPPQRQVFAGVPAGALQEALNASDDMKAIIGLYDASLGARSNETSGVAIVARQREGDTATFHFVDNLSRAIKHTGRILLDLIPHVYTGPRIVRVIGPDESVQTVPVNQQVPGPDGRPAVFDLTAGKYDLTVEAGPSYATKRAEAATQMVEFVRSFPGAGPLIGDLLAKNLDWPGAEEIAARLRAMLPPQLQGQGDPRLQQAQQMMQGMQQQLQQASQAVQSLQQQLDAAKADRQIKAREVDVKAYSAETDRLQAVAGGMTPEAVQALVIQTLQQVLGSPDVLQGRAPMPMPQMPPQGMPAPTQRPYGA